LFTDESILANWLNEKYPELLCSLKQALANQKALSIDIVSDLTSKSTNTRNELKINIQPITRLN